MHISIKSGIVMSYLILCTWEPILGIILYLAWVRRSGKRMLWQEIKNALDAFDIIWMNKLNMSSTW